MELTLLYLYLASIVINFLMFHYQSKKDGFANPFGLLFVFMFFLGTAVLGLISIFYMLEKFYDKSN